jgi:hypothetical protein
LFFFHQIKLKLKLIKDQSTLISEETSSVVIQKGRKTIQHAEAMKYSSLVSETEEKVESLTLKSTTKIVDETKEDTNLAKLVEKMQPLKEVETTKPQTVTSTEARKQPQQAAAFTRIDLPFLFFKLNIKCD